MRCESDGPAKTGALPSDDGSNGKRWITLVRLSGNCDASSSRVHVKGVDTRLVFRNDADSFYAFVIDAEQGIEGSAGYADAECTGPCSDTQVLVNPEGDYSLRVQAGDAPWEVLLQEYR